MWLKTPLVDLRKSSMMKNLTKTLEQNEQHNVSVVYFRFDNIHTVGTNIKLEIVRNFVFKNKTSLGLLLTKMWLVMMTYF